MEPTAAETLDGQIDQVADALPDIGVALAVFLAFVAVGWLLGRLIRVALQRRGDSVHAGFLGKLPVWLLGAVGLIVAAGYLGLEGLTRGLLAGGGATAIILGFAFREVGENLLAGLFLMLSRPFRIGDLIRSGGLPEGTVRAVDLRNTHIRAADGSDIFIPNAHVFNQPLVNFTRDGLRRPIFTVGIDYHDPLDVVRAEILDRMSGVEGVLERPEPRVMVVEFAAPFVLLEVTVWINTFAGSDYALVQTAAMEACRRAILDNGWTISADTKSAVALSGRLQTGPAEPPDPATAPR